MCTNRGVVLRNWCIDRFQYLLNCCHSWCSRRRSRRGSTIRPTASAKLRKTIRSIVTWQYFSISVKTVVSRVRGRKTSMVQGRDARLVATDFKRSRRSGTSSDKPKREENTPNSPRRAGNAQKQQTQALLTPINNGCQDYMTNANEG